MHHAPRAERATSAPNAASAQKLAFVRDVGAHPLWVRFGSGRVEKIDGVMVFDIRDATGACARQGLPELDKARRPDGGRHAPRPGAWSF